MYKVRRVAMISVIILSIIIAYIQFYTPVDASTTKLNMSYIYFGNKSIYIPLVEKTKGTLQVISPSYFDINEDGTLKLSDTLDVNFINEMKKKGVKITPFFSNHWSRTLGRAALQNKEIITNQIVDAINKYNLDGINVDIENVTEVDKVDYVELVKLLRQKLPKDKVVSVAVAANPRGFTTGWHGSYDYKALADNSDYLVIMSYDESWEGSSPGPVSSVSFVEKSIIYALNKGVSEEKIVIGIPFYGRLWNDDKNTWTSTNSWNGDGVSLTKAIDIMNRYNVQASYDEANQTPYVKLTVEPGKESIVYNKREMYAGNYTIWFENEASIKSKLKLVTKYNIKGAATWSLGQEPDSTWDYFDLWLNGKYFTDISNHWAEESINSVQNKGWMVGTSSTKFSPDIHLTRAEAAVTLVRALGLGNSEYKSDFNDVSENHWAKSYIDIAAQNGLFIGDGSQKFSPDRAMSRQEMAVVMDRVISKSESEIVQTAELNKDFTDIKPEDWSYNSIIKLSQKGILQGYPNGTFGPVDNMTRAQMATLINNISYNDTYLLAYK